MRFSSTKPPPVLPAGYGRKEVLPVLLITNGFTLFHPFKICSKISPAGLTFGTPKDTLIAQGDSPEHISIKVRKDS